MTNIHDAANNSAPSSLQWKEEICLKSTNIPLSYLVRMKANRSQACLQHIYCTLCNYLWRHFLNQGIVSTNSHLKQLMVTSFPVHGGLFLP